MSDLQKQAVETLDGNQATLGALAGSRPARLVNVASRGGLTPQYVQLERVHEQYRGRGSPSSASRATSSPGRNRGRPTGSPTSPPRPTGLPSR